MSLLLVLFAASVTLAVPLLLATAGVVRIPPLLIALLPYLFY